MSTYSCNQSIARFRFVISLCLVDAYVEPGGIVLDWRQSNSPAEASNAVELELQDYLHRE